MSNHQQKLDASLEPYRILDLTEGGGMIGARMLADLGADVIKIEPPGGSPSRIAPYYKDIPDPDKSLYWFAYNLNKRGITLDITEASGQSMFKKLAETADVVMESFQPGYLDSLGLGYADLVRIKPDIIMTSITPFGQNGPKSQYKGSDLTAWASGSYLYVNGNPDRPPMWISFPQAMLFGGAEAAVGTITALWHRMETGEGQQVDVSVQECVMSPTMNSMQMWDLNKVEFLRNAGFMYIPSTGVRQPIYFRCKDGYVLILLQGGNDPFASSSNRLVQWMDEEGMASDWLKKIDWVVDYNAATMGQDTADRGGAEVEKFTLTKTKAELYEEGAIKRRILIAPVNNARDIREDKQLQFRQYWVSVDHPELGKSLTYCGPAVRLSQTPIAYRKRAPLIGEHNEEILGKESGISKQKAAAQKQNMNVTGTSIGGGKAISRAAKKVFAGIKVAEFAWVAVGPVTSRYLADHGATVVKIESHNRLDTLRVTSPYAGGTPHVDGSMFFGRYNANKYGVSIDLNHPNGRKLAWKFIMWADVVTESFSPGNMEKWGLDYESVKKVRPDIIYLSTCMQGHGGPHANYIGYGPNACALCGFSEISGWPDRPPAAPYGAYTDFICPRFGALSLMAALEYRRRTGKGQLIEQSQFESALHFFSPPLMDYMVNGRIFTRQGNRWQTAAPHGVFPCQGNDRWVALSVFSDQEWAALCRVMSKPELAHRKEFATLARRKENEDELEKLIAAWTAHQTAEEVERLLQSAGVAAHVVAKSSDVYEDVQLKHRKYFSKLKHPVMGEPSFEPQACYILAKTPRELRKPSPCLGQHNEYVFKELLGMTDDEIAEHIIDGSITTQLPGGLRVNM